MEIITLTCKVISPMFIGNANGKNAELRPSTIEGSLRFWWRAIHPDLSKYELRKQETEFFGGSYQDKDDNNKTVNKPPSYRFLSIESEDIEIEDVFIDARKESSIKNVRDSGKSGKAYAFSMDQIFKIKLQILTNKSEVLALFKLTSALGSLGKRSRRGAGAWKIEKINEENDIVYDKEDIDKWIKTINPNYQNNTNTPDYPYLKEYTIGTVTYTKEVDLRIRIMVTAHYCKKESNHKNSFNSCLGVASGKTRLSSPVYVSMIEDSKGVKPIISTLNHKRCEDNTIQQEFISCILTTKNCN